MLVNKEIKFKEVLLINENGEKVGVVSIGKAMFLAKSAELDLVCVSEKGNPPVCKILDYGKLRFEEQKKEKESKKKSKVIETSEIQISFTISDHDAETKANTAKRLIEKGNLVRVVMRLRGREITVADRAIEKTKNFANKCSEFAKIKKDAVLEGRDVRLILEPLSNN